MDLKKLISIFAGKISIGILNRFSSGATALPGLVSETFDRNILKKLSENLRTGSILITGTNGKTTTSRILSCILKEAGVASVHNRSGSNLTRGLVSALLKTSTLTGKIEPDLGLFEVDEATLPLSIPQVLPNIIIINNLFRDQLDRYGEIDTIRKKWEDSLKLIDRETYLVLNADDPTVASLETAGNAKVLFFGTEDPKQGSLLPPKSADSLRCPRCGHNLKFEFYYYSHLGKYLCANCQFKRPNPDIVATDIKIESLDSTKVNFITPKEKLKLTLKLGGVYNVYNTLAAISAAVALGLDLEIIKKGLENFEAAFGRQEKLEIDSKNVYILLVKNPTGFNESLKFLLNGNEKKNLLILINDRIADGTDVSWLWDVDIGILKGKIKSLSVGGTRSADMALRLKYAGIGDNFTVKTDIEESLVEALRAISVNETLFILPTYTAMLELKKIFAFKGVAKPFYED
ncbi:MAG: hypothetical protein A2Y57_03050 [Candidatus Woykebacteria bacterium RBG_13_40_7b]|uniref:Lipid II isoglutaminyl synthase (glutamine-hydrolyzing) subunit MurT n=1 Tax=Candidatus Woykebacteria bacterium RBG_13_40_7b TaxID=1802594 RepID=A0A1G1W8G2_9BACT|nr:MAG: hypothetical protein A2Y57_03050 [Candidatus Woykebacteria bacterium RBG_13_40_7b]